MFKLDCCLLYTSDVYKRQVQEFTRVLAFAKRAYAHRRKLLAGNLAGGSATRETIETVIESMGFTKTARAEELSPVQILDLFRRL